LSKDIKNILQDIFLFFFLVMPWTHV